MLITLKSEVCTVKLGDSAQRHGDTEGHREGELNNWLILGKG